MWEGLQAIRKAISSSKVENVDKDEVKDGYQLRFVGKNYAKFITGLPTETLLVPDTEWNNQTENKNSQNIFITGDNLDALKHLVNAYSGQVKMIYIDPPYNTGSDDFVYKDNFNFTNQELQEKLELTEKEVERIRALDGKCSHSAWLSFMLPRLVLAKQLLAKDGVIFISIDDNEQANLKLLCDEIFRGGFVTTIHCQMSTTQGMKVKAAQEGNIVKNAEYILCYSNDGHQNIAINPLYDLRPEYDEHYSLFLKSNGEIGQLSELYNYKFPKDCNNKKPLKLAEAYKKSEEFAEIVRLHLAEIVCSDKSPDFDDMPTLKQGYWKEIERKGKKYLLTLDSSGNMRQLLRLKDSWGTTDGYYSEEGLRKIRGNWWSDFYIDMGNVSKEGDMAYKNGKKPVRLIKQLIQMLGDKKALVLDFFAGSATTAHAVMALNEQDKGKRQYIMVQLPELTYTFDKDGKEKPKKGSEDAYNAGYKTIDQISRTRINNAAKELGDTSGFKHYKLAKIQDGVVLEKIDNFDPSKQLTELENMLAPLSGKELKTDLKATGVETLLNTWLVDDGYMLTTPIQEVKLGNYTAYSPEGSKLLYFIEPGWNSEATKDLLNKIGKGNLIVQRVVIYNYSFNFGSLTELKTNLKSVLDEDKRVEIIERF